MLGSQTKNGLTSLTGITQIKKAIPRNKKKQRPNLILKAVFHLGFVSTQILLKILSWDMVLNVKHVTCNIVTCKI